MLLSDVNMVRLALVEGSSDGRVLVRGEFAKCGVATENKRVYPKGVWEKEISRLDKALKSRRVLGEVDHPSSGQTSLSRVSHVLTGLSIEDGIVIGEAEILPTSQGRELTALLKANVPVGVSSRGFGSVKQNPRGEDVVQEDYTLRTFDFVADPADIDAYPEMKESLKASKGLFEGIAIPDEATKVAADGKPGQSPETLRAEFTASILSHMTVLKAEAVEQAKQELLADPTVAGARAAIEQVREILKPFILPEDVAEVVRGKDAEIQRLRNQLAEQTLLVKGLGEENDKLVGLAREVGFRAFIEKMLSGDPDAEAIRNLLGDLKQYESSEALKAKLGTVRSEMQKKRDEAKQAESDAAAEKARIASAALASESAAAKQIRALEAQLAEESARRVEAEGTARKALAEAKKANTQAYAEEQARMSGKVAEARRRLAEAKIESKEDVDDALGKLREPVRDPEQHQETRSRIRRMAGTVGREVEEGRETEETRVRRPRNGSNNYLDLGVDIETLKRLSGIHSGGKN